MHKIQIANLDDSVKFGRLLATTVAKSEISPVLITLSGDLGAGKTTLVKAIGEGLEVSEVITSPTFTTMNEYHSGFRPLYHVDLYRVGEGKNNSLSYFVLEFEEILDSPASVVVIEWPEFFKVDNSDYLENLDRLTVRIDPNSEGAPNSRTLIIEAFGAEIVSLAEALVSAMQNR